MAENTTPDSPALRYTTVAAVIVVGLVAAIVSYSHMQNFGRTVGESWRSYLIPLSIDGLMVAASMVLVTRRRAGLPASGVAWGALGVGTVASLAANMADASGSVAAILYAGWAPVALAGGIELLLIQRRAVAPTVSAAREVEVPAVVVDTPAPASHPIGGLLKISEGKPPSAHIEDRRGPVIEALRVQRPLQVTPAPVTKTPLRLVSRPAGRAPVRDAAVRWLAGQARKGVDLNTITPQQLATGARLKVDTCRRNLVTWRAEVRQEASA